MSAAMAVLRPVPHGRRRPAARAGRCLAAPSVPRHDLLDARPACRFHRASRCQAAHGHRALPHLRVGLDRVRGGAPGRRDLRGEISRLLTTEHGPSPPWRIADLVPNLVPESAHRTQARPAELPTARPYLGGNVRQGANHNPRVGGSSPSSGIREALQDARLRAFSLAPQPAAQPRRSRDRAFHRRAQRRLAADHDQPLSSPRDRRIEQLACQDRRGRRR
jgi:hypothetical protein